MNIFLKNDSIPAIFLIGGTGAGKTEIALNLSVYNARHYQKATLIDLDIVNPFFRVRKLIGDLLKENVTVICPPVGIREIDVPALPAAAWGAIGDCQQAVVCDVGGGEAGLRLLGRMRELADAREASVFFVLNPYRPDFTTDSDLEKSFYHMSELSAMKATHIVANPNLGNDTDAEVFRKGLDRIRKFSEKSKVPIAFAIASSNVARSLSVAYNSLPEFVEYEDLPLFILERYWSIPWSFGTVQVE